MDVETRLAAGRRYLRPAVDGLLALAVLATTLLRGFGVAEPTEPVYVRWDPPLWFVITVAIVLGFATWQRRRHPMIFWATALVAFVPLATWLAVVLAQYTVGERTTSWRKPVLATAGAAAVVFVPVWQLWGADAAIPLSMAICGVPALLGLYVSTRREFLAELRGRADRAERDRDQRIAQARTAERAQIARDMHDVVTHRVSLIVLHATALEATQGRNAVAIGQQIGTIGRDALTELRSLVAVLRADGDRSVPLTPQPGLADLDDLVAESQRAGLPVTLRLHEGPARPPALVEHAVYRVVQEALTNAHKHSGGAATSVEVSHTSSLLQLAVVSGPPVGVRDAGLPSGGQGLLGITERIRLVGGDLRTEQLPDGGFRVRAEIPLSTEGTQ